MNTNSNHINIHKIIYPENKFLFSIYPQLNTIWECVALQTDAQNSFENWNPVTSTGEIFLIKENVDVIGIIGWFYDNNFVDVLRLRYYGIIPSKRGNGYGYKVMNLFLKHLELNTCNSFKWLSESVSINRTCASDIISHFKNLGFAEFYDPNYGSNANCGPVKSLKIRLPNR